MKPLLSMLLSTMLMSSCVLLSSCATNNTFFVNNAPPDSSLIVGDRAHPITPTQPVVVSVETGTDPVPWRVERAGVVVDEGVVERTDIEWGTVVLGTGMAACCMPSGAMLGFCLANPSLFAAPFTLVVGDAGSVVNTIQSPGWASIPFTTIGIAGGSIPLLLALVAQSPPDVVNVTLPPLPKQAAPAPPTKPNTPRGPFADDPDEAPLPPSSTSPEPSIPTPTPSLDRPAAQPLRQLRDEAVAPLPPAVDDGAASTSRMSF